MRGGERGLLLELGKVEGLAADAVLQVLDHRVDHFHRLARDRDALVLGVDLLHHLLQVEVVSLLLLVLAALLDGFVDGLGLGVALGGHRVGVAWGDA